MKLYYGLKSKAQIFEVVDRTCEVLGNGGNDNADRLLLRTAATETQFGTFPDSHPLTKGVGLFQHDLIALRDIKLNSTEHFDVIEHELGYIMPNILLEDLAYNPELSAICARLTYMRVPAAIPIGLEAQGKYWKEHYNTVAGKGSVKHFIESANRWEV